MGTSHCLPTLGVEWPAVYGENRFGCRNEANGLTTLPGDVIVPRAPGAEWESNGRFPFMRVTVDRVGRIVIPKGLRDQLGLQAEDELDATIDGHAIRLEPRQATGRVVVDRNGIAVLRSVGDGKLTDRMVRDLRDAERR